MGIIVEGDKKCVLKCRSVWRVKEIVLNESFNGKITYLSTFEFREKKLKRKLRSYPCHKGRSGRCGQE